MLRKHVRQPDPMPRDRFYHFGCSCGWEGKVPVVDKGHVRNADELRDAAEAAWVAHVPPRERRVYLLLDTRRPDLSEEEAAAFGDAPVIRGNFLMPEGQAVTLLGTQEIDDLYWGKFQTEPDGPVDMLPVGEIRTPDGKVWCAE